jgi:hypothetical protein
MAGVYAQHVLDVIGELATKAIMKAVKCNTINQQKMLDFARALHPQIGGKHDKRMNEKNTSNDETEMKNIFSDMWEFDDDDDDEETAWMDKNKNEILQQLIKIFKKISVRPLAKELEKFLDVSDGASIAATAPVVTGASSVPVAPSVTKLTLSGVMEEEIPRPHRPGKQLRYNGCNCNGCNGRNRCNGCNGCNCVAMVVYFEYNITRF